MPCRVTGAGAGGWRGAPVTSWSRVTGRAVPTYRGVTQLRSVRYGRAAPLGLPRPSHPAAAGSELAPAASCTGQLTGSCTAGTDVSQRSDISLSQPASSSQRHQSAAAEAVMGQLPASVSLGNQLILFLEIIPSLYYSIESKRRSRWQYR